MAEQTFNVNLDLSQIENMKCICGNDLFLPVVNLKYLSPIQCGNPNGGQIIVQHFMCANPNCPKIYEKALPPDEVEKLYGDEKKTDGVSMDIGIGISENISAEIAKK